MSEPTPIIYTNAEWLLTQARAGLLYFKLEPKGEPVLLKLIEVPPPTEEAWR